MTASFAAVPLLLALAGSPASVGTGIQAGPVCLPVTAQPGSTYTLPVTVADTGSGSETIGLQVQNPGSEPGKGVPASWVRFSAPVTLASGAKGTMTAHLTLPPSAHGAYAAWIVAGPAGTGTPGQLSLGAEAIASFRFTVTRPGHAPRHVSCAAPAVVHAGAHSAHRIAVTPAASVTAARHKAMDIITGVALGLLILFFVRRRAS